MGNRTLAIDLIVLQQRVSQLRQNTSLDQERATEEKEQQQLVGQLQSTLRELSRAEEELRQKDEALSRARKVVEAERTHYQRFFELTTEGYVTSDIAGTIREVNRAALALLQYDSDRLRGTSLIRFFPPTEQVAVLSRLMRLRATRQTEAWETSLYPFEGQPFPIYVSVSVRKERGEEEEIFYWVLHAPTRQLTKEPLCSLNSPPGSSVEIRGITSAIQAELEEQRRTEELLLRFSTALEMSDESIVVCDLDGKILYVNESACQGYGTDERKDLIGKNSLDLVVPEDRTQAQAALKQALTTGRGKSQEYKVMNRAGEQILVESSLALIHSAQGSPLGFVNILRNITERKRTEESLRQAYAELEFRVHERTAELEQRNAALREEIAQRQRVEQALRESEARAHAVFENASDAIALIALDGTVMSANRGVEILLHQNRIDVVGKLYTDFLTPASAQLTMERFRRAAVGERLPSLFELELRQKGGDTIPVEARTRFLRDHTGRVTGILGIYRDITERKRTEEELRKAHDKLEERVQERTEELMRANAALQREVRERKRAEEMARAAEAEYRSIFENASEGIYRSSINGQQLRANPALVKLNGYSSEEEQIAAVNDIAIEWYVDPQRREEFKRLLDENGHITNFESEVYRHKTRERIWISENARLVRDEAGHPLYYEGTVQDITARKRAEGALRASEAQYRLLFEHNPNPTWVCDAETLSFLAVNDAAVRHYGYSRSEFLSMTILDIRPPEDRSLIQSRFQQIRRQEVSQGVWRHQKKDGSILFVEIVSHDMFFAGRPGRIVLVRDITEQKRAEDALRQTHLELERRVQERTAELVHTNTNLQVEIAERQHAEATLARLQRQNEQILNAAEEGIFGIDREGRVAFVNPAAAKMLHFAVAELVGQSLQSLHNLIHYSRIDGQAHPFEECSMRVTLRDGVVMRQADDLYWRKDGTNFPVESICAPIRGEQEEILGAVVTFQDITQRKEVDRMKDELISTVSHELRTPLASLRGFAELLLTRVFPAERQHEFFTIIHKESLRLTKLINDFLDLQRIEAGRQPYTFAAVAVEPLLRDIVTLFAKEGASHVFHLDLTLPVPPVLADEERLQQVLANLLSNAIKFSPKGGTIVLGARIDADVVMFRVQDQGVGIPEEALPKLFNKFYRVDNTATRDIGGTGLGLALVKELVTAHRGRVWVESTLGQGSTFFFTVPLFNDQSL